MKDHTFLLVAGDTDGIAFKKRDEKPFTDEERKSLVDELNARMDELIRWEDDGVYKTQIVLAAKNYVLEKYPKDCKKGEATVKFKGNSVKATYKSKVSQRFIQELIECLLKNKKDHIFAIYNRYAEGAFNLTDISDWCSKKTITKAVLNPERTTEQRVLDAIEDADVNEGDKIYVFNKTKEELCLRENFDGTYCVDTLLRKLYDTLSIFGTVIDIDLFPNYTLKKNKELLKVTVTIPVIDRPVFKDGALTSPFPAGFFQVRS